MESYKEYEEDEVQRRVKSCTGGLLSFLVSLIGGLLLGWWEYRHHPTNTQLWMVPFGLILFLTPLIVCLFVFIADLCNPESHLNQGKPNDVDSVALHLDLGKNIKQVTC